MKSIAIFGSAKSKEGEPNYKLAFEVGRLLAERGYAVVNGGYGGVMEASARGAKEGGGKTVGVTTTEFSSRCNRFIDEEIKVYTWQERVMALMSRADAYVVLDGGTGTLVEFSVAVEMMNKGLLQKKPLVVYGSFWKNVKEVLEKNPEIKLDFVKIAGSPEEIIRAVSAV